MTGRGGKGSAAAAGRADEDAAGTRAGGQQRRGSPPAPIAAQPPAARPDAPDKPEPAPATAHAGDGRALVPADLRPPRGRLVDPLVRAAYRLGVPGHWLEAPLARPPRPRLLAAVRGAVEGDRAAGMALRAGQVSAGGAQLAAARIDWGPVAKLPAPFLAPVHGFSWLADLAACGPHPGDRTAEKMFRRWHRANRMAGRGAAWSCELTGRRLLAWLVHAPLLLAGEARLKDELLGAIEVNARHLDRAAMRGPDRLAQAIGHAALAAAGLLVSGGRPRRLHGEAGLLRALGEAVGEDGGVLSRSPAAQALLLATLCDLRACYRATEADPPPGIERTISHLVPALLAVRMGDRGLGSWQGAGATDATALDRLIAASAVRARPLAAPGHWGYHRVAGRGAVLVMDAAPPPRMPHARNACAGTLAFELSVGEERLVVNCGGADLAGALVPARIEQGLRGTAAHSTLILDGGNSTNMLLGGGAGAGAGTVSVSGRTVEAGTRRARRIEAAHDGYVARHGLAHRRILTLFEDGSALAGEDILEPAGKAGRRGKIAFAIRFHLGAGVDAAPMDNGRAVHLALAGGSTWQFRLGGDTAETRCLVEDSLWVDGTGQPRPIQQIVVQGLAARGGARYSWLLQRMG